MSNGFTEYVSEFISDSEYDTEQAQRIVAEYGTGHDGKERIKDYVESEMLDMPSYDSLALCLIREALITQVEWYDIVAGLAEDNPFMEEEEENDHHIEEQHGKFMIISYLDGDKDWATTAWKDGKEVQVFYYASADYTQREAIDDMKEMLDEMEVN